MRCPPCALLRSQTLQVRRTIPASNPVPQPPPSTGPAPCRPLPNASPRPRPPVPQPHCQLPCGRVPRTGRQPSKAPGSLSARSSPPPTEYGHTSPPQPGPDQTGTRARTARQRRCAPPSCTCAPAGRIRNRSTRPKPAAAQPCLHAEPTSPAARRRRLARAERATGLGQPQAISATSSRSWRPPAGQLPCLAERVARLAVTSGEQMPLRSAQGASGEPGSGTVLIQVILPDPRAPCNGTPLRCRTPRLRHPNVPKAGMHDLGNRGDLEGRAVRPDHVAHPGDTVAGPVSAHRSASRFSEMVRRPQRNHVRAKVHRITGP
jgi:hypothetical protein